MTLSELIECAVDAQKRFGDLAVVILDNQGNNFFDIVELEVMVADVKVSEHRDAQTVFAFMATVGHLKNDMQ